MHRIISPTRKTFKKGDHDLFNAKDVEAFSDFVEYVLKRGEWVHILCFAVQVASFWGRFCACTKEAEEGTGQKEVLAVEQTPLFFTYEHGGYLQFPWLKRRRPTNVEKHASHFWCKKLPSKSTRTLVWFDVPDDKKSTHPGWKNQTSSAPHLLQDERLFRTGSSASSSNAFFVWSKRTCWGWRTSFGSSPSPKACLCTTVSIWFQWLRQVCFYHSRGGLSNVP